MKLNILVFMRHAVCVA